LLTEMDSLEILFRLR